MPEPTPETRSEEYPGIKKRIQQNIDNISELTTILKTLRGLDNVPMADKVDLMLIVFTTESKSPKYDLITYLWNFLKILYNNMDKLVLKLVPAIAIDRNTELTEKHLILYKEITTRLYYVMVFMKDTNAVNIEIMCKNVLLLSKYLLKQQNYTEFFNLAKETFFNPKHSYQIKLFTNQPSPANDLFLEHYLTRLWEFRDTTEVQLIEKGTNSGEIFEKFFQIFIFFVNYEGRQPPSKYPLTDKLISVLLNLHQAKDSKEICNSIKCLYSLVQLMKEDAKQETASKLFLQYMSRICEKSILNTSPFAADALATIAVVLERNPYFTDEKHLQTLSLESVRYLLQTIKLTGSLNVEPEKSVCEIKDCVKGSKKHTITNLTRFAQKLFVCYVGKLKDGDPMDEDLLAIVTQLVFFHFHVLERLTCSSRMANEHNDVRRLYSTFAHRCKSNPPANILTIFERVFKYAMQRNLSALVNALAMLLVKYYTEMNDQVNSDRIEWINLLCKHGDSAQSSAFDDCCYNWAVKKQKLAKEELTPVLLAMKATKLDYSTEMIAAKVTPEAVFLRVLESIAVLNYKAFRVLQECLVEIILDQWTDQCSEEIVNLLFYATEGQILNYKETIMRNKEFFEKEQKKHKSSSHWRIPLAVLNSLEYQVYNAELRHDLKKIDMNVLQNKEVPLPSLSLARDNAQLEYLRSSMDHLQDISSGKPPIDPWHAKQVVGTLKRNIRFFQLAGLEFEEVNACRLLYDLSKQLKDTESSLLAMANLMNHVHFIIHDERCRKEFPHLLRTINGEGSDLLANHLKTLETVKEPLQILIVFGIGNIIKLNADLGRLEKSHEYLCTLRQKIDEVSAEKEEQSVNQLQYDLISFQLYLKYAPQSQVNPLMVVRRLFQAVRLLHKVSDLYALYLYDVLVELFCFSVPRYETKGLDFFICTVLKYFMGIGSVTRIVDVLLIYSNWALCCENLEKCVPAMEYVADILTRPLEGEQRMKVVEAGDEQFTKKVSQAILSLDSNASIWLQIVGFKLNCLLARKLYIDRCYEQSRKRYEDAWTVYETLNGQIANYSLKMEFQQFYVNALFQLSNVYYKLNMPTKSYQFCEQTTVMISEILVNRLALTQEAFFQELPFKGESSHSASAHHEPQVSPIQLEIAMLMNEKKGSKSSRKKVSTATGSSKEGTPAKTVRRAKQSSKTPGKASKSKVTSPDTFPIPSLAIVDENSSRLCNNLNQTEEIPRRSAVGRRIPVRNSTTAKDPLAKSVSSIAVPKKRTPTSVATTDAPAVTSISSTRKTSRRLI